MNTMRWTAFAAALASSVVAGMAHAQGIGGEEIANNDWMTSGLAPLVLLLGLGILVALIAAAVAAVTLGTTRRRFRGPHEA